MKLSFVMVPATTALALLIMIFPQMARSANCGSQSVDWPTGVKNSCGAQLIYNGGAEIGANSSPLMDTRNSSQANFICTETGWVYQWGECNIKRNIPCVQQKLRVSAPQLGLVSEDLVQQILDTTVTAVRQNVVDAVNECDEAGK